MGCAARRCVWFAKVHRTTRATHGKNRSWQGACCPQSHASRIANPFPDLDNVYWAEDGDPLWRAPASGGPAVQLVDAKVHAIAQDELAVYYLASSDELWKLAK